MSDLGDEIFSKIKEDKNPLSKLIEKIPGFSGYIKSQDRRNADALLRETISAGFEREWGRVSDLQQEFLSAGEIMYIDDLERAAIRLRTFADRIKTAARGYSGFLAAVKIGEEELTKIYEYDLAMLEMVDEVARGVDHVQASIGTDGVSAAIRNLQTVAQQCIDAFNKREEVILAV